MSPYVSTHALERAIAKTAHGVIESLEKRQEQLGYDSLRELHHQIQVPISGTARSGAGWQTFGVAFDVDFFFAPHQRDSPFSVPHFTSGAVVQGEPPMGQAPDPNNPDSLVAVTCQVVEWARDSRNGAITGAIIGVGVSTIGGNDVDFDGYLHLTFQGYGAPPEDVPQLDVGQ